MAVALFSFAKLDRTAIGANNREPGNEMNLCSLTLALQRSSSHCAAFPETAQLSGWAVLFR